MSKPPVRPRDAASLILLRDTDSDPRVLMGRRPLSSRFMPGVYVFPGGAVDPGDAEVPAATEPDRRITPGLKVHGNAARARALAVAAVRETFEETGLMLGAPSAAPVPASPDWAPWRRQGIAPDLARLQLLGRAITPSVFPIRFSARFFYARGEDLHGRIRGNGELEEIGWQPLRNAEHLPLADVQYFMIGQLRRLLDGRPSRPGVPLFTHRHGKPYVRYQR